MVIKLKKIRLKNWMKIFILVFFFLILMFSSYKIIKYILDTKSMNDINEEVLINASTQEIQATENAENVNPPIEKTSDYWTFIKTSFLDVDFDELLKKNNDTVAWIQINNTNVNYPIVQAKNNEYYLKKAFDKSYNSAGWIFMDYRNDAKNFETNTIVYGHSMKNTTMFGTLLKARNKSWYTDKSNWIIKLSTPYEFTLWQIFSLYSIDPESYYIKTDFNNESDISMFFNNLKERSIYDFKTEINAKDKILTLSTCSSTNGKKRFVIHAKIIKREAR